MRNMFRHFSKSNLKGFYNMNPFKAIKDVNIINGIEISFVDTAKFSVYPCPWT